MLNYLKKTTSLANFTAKRIPAQAATIMIIFIVVLLIIILITANLGQVSLQATSLSNAVDASALLLGSLLSTKANAIAQQLYAEEDCRTSDDWRDSAATVLKCCKRGGLAVVVLAVLLAIVAIVILVTSGGSSAPLSTWMLVGAVGGLVGGAIGGAIVQGTWEGAAVGAFLGMAFGAAVGAGAGAIFAAPAAVGGGAATGGITAGTQVTNGVVSGAAVVDSSGMVIGIETGAATVAITPSIAVGTSTTGATMLAPVATTGVTAAAGISSTYLVLGILSIASTVYNELSIQKNTAAAMRALAKSINGLPEYERLREQAFLNTLSLSVDDPNMVKDTQDLDEDENRDEFLPAMLYWWDKRIKAIKKLVTPRIDTVELTRQYQEQMKEYRQSTKGILDLLQRREIECPCSEDFPTDGRIIRAWRTALNCPNLKKEYRESGTNIPFTPGPDKQALLDWYRADCSQCEPPNGMDNVDKFIMIMEDFLTYTSPLVRKRPHVLETTYNDWIGRLVHDGEYDAGWINDCGGDNPDDSDDAAKKVSFIGEQWDFEGEDLDFAFESTINYFVGDVQDDYLGMMSPCIPIGGGDWECWGWARGLDKPRDIPFVPPCALKARLGGTPPPPELSWGDHYFTESNPVVNCDNNPANAWFVRPCEHKEYANVIDDPIISNFPCRSRVGELGNNPPSCDAIVGGGCAPGDAPGPNGDPWLICQTKLAKYQTSPEKMQERVIAMFPLDDDGKPWPDTTNYNVSITNMSLEPQPNKKPKFCDKKENDYTRELVKIRYSGGIIINPRDGRSPVSKSFNNEQFDIRAGLLDIPMCSYGDFQAWLNNMDRFARMGPKLAPNNGRDIFQFLSNKIYAGPPMQPNLDHARWGFVQLSKEFIDRSYSYVAAMKGATRNYARNGADWSYYDTSVPGFVDYGNPCVYEWQDSRGKHSVGVSTNAFRVPKMVTFHSGNWLVNKDCLTLVCNQGTADINAVRKDEANVEVKSNKFSLAKWNPFGAENNEGIIKKRARVRFSVIKDSTRDHAPKAALKLTDPLQ